MTLRILPPDVEILLIAAAVLSIPFLLAGWLLNWLQNRKEQKRIDKILRKQQRSLNKRVYNQHPYVKSENDVSGVWGRNEIEWQNKPYGGWEDQVLKSLQEISGNPEPPSRYTASRIESRVWPEEEKQTPKEYRTAFGVNLRVTETDIFGDPQYGEDMMLNRYKRDALGGWHLELDE